MKKKNILLSLIIVAIFFSCTCNKDKVSYELKKDKDKNGYEYEYVTNDPINARIYTLKNGLKVFLTVNKDAPRLSSFIGVKAGSTYDPKDNTGLAHYLEHMMFKGTSSIGTINWNEEAKLLQQISELYEKHKATADKNEKKKIYAEIDKLSQEAAKYAVANEFDKMCTNIGASNTNAYTSEERTVYMNDIPKNELEKYLLIEKERFTDLVLRLFHTELETVYEEFNMYQDEDSQRQYEKLMSNIFKKHPYGQQTTIGKPEHLKNPSMKAIMEYYRTYYVPNNMAIAISGDIDFDETIALIDKIFGTLKPGNPVEKERPKEDPITKHEEYSVYGPESENVLFAFRFNGRKSEDYKYVTIIDNLLSNNKAGLIDINLVQQQKVLEAYSFTNFDRDYGLHVFSGKPREGQKLEDVKNLLLEQLEKIKKGEFEDWMIEAIANNMRLNRIRQQESNWRAHEYIVNFSLGVDWLDYVKFPDEVEKVTKQQIVDFANKYYGDNYVAVYKRIGQDTNIVKVEKPQITPLKLNRDTCSAFFARFEKMPSGKEIEPVFLDYKSLLKKDKLPGDIDMYYLQNTSNELFQVCYIVDMGSKHNLKLPLAVNFLPYLGTTKYSPADFQKELYRYGLSLGVHSSDDRSYIYVSGLKKSLAKGLEMLEDLLANVKADEKSYKDYVDKILKQRADDKLNKDIILWNALKNYGQYGKKSPFTDILTEEQLRSIKPSELEGIIKDIFKYKHFVFFYGQEDFEQAKKTLAESHKVSDKLKDYPQAVDYPELDIAKNQVYFVNYDMVQTNVLMLTKCTKFNKELYPISELFGEYFGGGLGSIVFQEIRESKGFAYSAFSYFLTPSKPEYSHYLISFIGTQPDKFKDAVQAMLDIFNKMPRAQKQFDISKEAILKRIRSERITKASIFWNYLSLKDLGIDYDVRKTVFEKVPKTTMDDMASFVEQYIKNKNFVFLVIGNKNSLKHPDLAKFGEVKELTLEEIFNY